MFESEKIFADYYKTQTGFDLIYEPATFRVGDYKFRPDFYCPITGKFFEVSGSRQAYHQDKFKFKAFREIFKTLTLEVVHPDGTAYTSHLRGYRSGLALPVDMRRREHLDKRRVAAKLLCHAYNESSESFREIARRVGLHWETVRGIVFDGHLPQMANTRKIMQSLIGSEKAS